MTSIVKCDHCTRTYQFKDREAGKAWMRVDVIDGDETPDKGEAQVLVTASFCCPECAEAYLCNPELMGTIRFPDPIGCHGAREANFPIISRNCHDQIHSSCCGRAVKECQCYCHAEKAISGGQVNMTPTLDPLGLPPLAIVDDRTFEEKLHDGDVSLEPDEVYCDVCTWPKRLCVCAGTNKVRMP